MTQAADTLYRQAGEQFAPALARLARAVERDPDKARDLEQEMHCALWTSLARFKGDCALKTWVYRVAHNVAADHVARAMRGPKKVPLEEIRPGQYVAPIPAREPGNWVLSVTAVRPGADPSEPALYRLKERKWLKP